MNGHPEVSTGGYTPGRLVNHGYFESPEMAHIGSVFWLLNMLPVQYMIISMDISELDLLALKNALMNNEYFYM